MHSAKPLQIQHGLAGLGYPGRGKTKAGTYRGFTKNFNLSETEITFEQYEVFAYLIAQEGGCKNTGFDGTTYVLGELDDSNFGEGQRPAINVSWYGAQCYALWLTEKTRIEKRPFRLQTEAEWEYAAQAGTNTVFYWGDDDPKNYAWFNENSGVKTQPVRQKKPNKFGLYDMSGNVSEWVQDCWHKDYTNAPPDGSAWELQNDGACSYRVLRGGSWYYNEDFLRSANRIWDYPYNHTNGIGFRLAQD